MTHEELQKLTVLLRLDIIEMIHAANYGYTGGSLSALDIIASLYFGEINGVPVLKYDTNRPRCDEQDYFILSKAHAAPALYAVLAEAGFFPKSDLSSFQCLGSRLQLFPHMKIPGVSIAPGSLGQGLSLAVGLALALKMDRKPNRTYVLLGDGELQKGQIWEAAMSAAHFELDNICAIVDRNEFQADGSTREVMHIDPIQDKFESFGWKVFRTLDGNNVFEILRMIEKAWNIQRRPTVILAHTVKGKGIPFVERKVSYHNSPLSLGEMQLARAELEQQLDA